MQGFWVRLCHSFLWLPQASCSFLQPPQSRRNAYNDENDSFDRAEEDLDDWKNLEACCAAASSSFLLLLAASYSYHEAIAMRVTRELVISTEWKGVWTVRKGSGLLHCCFLQLPRWKFLLWQVSRYSPPPPLFERFAIPYRPISANLTWI